MKVIPERLEQVKLAALRAIQPLKPSDASTRTEGKDVNGGGRRTNAGRSLPPYYLVYFLLVDLLGFRNYGQFEKVAYSIPVDFNGLGFLIDYRKFGVGVFAGDIETQEDAAKEIVRCVHRGVKAARPFFDWLADEAVASSKVNVSNHNPDLYARYRFLTATYEAKFAEAERRKDERVVKRYRDGGMSSTWPAFQIYREANWLVVSVVEAFFAWTEHLFIHLAVLLGNIKTATEVASLAEADWSVKFKSAIDIEGDAAAKKLFDRCVHLRREIRNYVAHGSFGKQGEAFQFHSGTGAVPVLLPHRNSQRHFSISESEDGDVNLSAKPVLALLKDFEILLWQGKRKRAKPHIESELPLILTYASDGIYASAMKSQTEMKMFVRHMSGEWDRSANMDW